MKPKKTVVDYRPFLPDTATKIPPSAEPKTVFYVTGGKVSCLTLPSHSGYLLDEKGNETGWTWKKKQVAVFRHRRHGNVLRDEDNEHFFTSNREMADEMAQQQQENRQQYQRERSSLILVALLQLERSEREEPNNDAGSRPTFFRDTLLHYMDRSDNPPSPALRSRGSEDSGY